MMQYIEIQIFMVEEKDASLVLVYSVQRVKRILR